MFVFQFMGGLGNQLFQYAAARAISIKRDIPFKIDFDDPYKYVKRKLNLAPFNLDFSIASGKELRKCKPKRRLEKRLWILMGKNPDNLLFREKNDYFFDSDFFDCPDGSYVSGFWQSEKYFNDIESVIRNDFTFRYPAAGSNHFWLEKIKSTNSVSVHIRRGDLVTVPNTNRLFGTVTMSYYEKAIKTMQDLFGNCEFYFFSDDMQWVRENLRIPCTAHFVEGNTGNNNFEDIRLMSSCRNHIIANSSFSWWGAWLNPHMDKYVIAPEKWISSLDICNTDHIPDSWKLL